MQAAPGPPKAPAWINVRSGPLWYESAFTKRASVKPTDPITGRDTFKGL